MFENGNPPFQQKSKRSKVILSYVLESILFLGILTPTLNIPILPSSASLSPFRLMFPEVSASSSSPPLGGQLLEGVPSQTNATANVTENGLPRVMFVTTGGTIQNMELPNGTNTRINLEDTIANIRERYPQPEVQAILDSINPSFNEVTRIGSEEFDLNEFLTIAWEAQKALDGEFDAVIVTQGTFSSEYTCYFLQLLVNSTKPIIVTNSQRQHMSVGNDGDRNLLDSILVATHPESEGKGALQVEGAKIVSCREVTKNSDRPGAFGAQNLGVLGYLRGGTLSPEATVPEDNVVYYREPTRQHTFESEFSIEDLINSTDINGNVTFRELPRVEVLPSFYGAQSDVVDALVSLDVEGIVVQGLASAGNPWEGQSTRLEELAEAGMPVVRTHSNQVVYDGRIPPSEPPFIGGDNLPSHKARILLQLAMVETEDLSGDERRNEIQRLFNTH
jgi:L-asparaginase